MSTYSNTSTYEPVVVKEGSHVRSGDVNVGDMPIYVQVDETYESSNYMNLMNIASVAPVYESKVEKIYKTFSTILYTCYDCFRTSFRYCFTTC